MSPQYCMVLMPYSGEFEAIYRSAIEPAFQDAGLRSLPTVGIPLGTNLTRATRDRIAAADFVIADMTTGNPNVLFEVGVARGYGKDVILLSQDAKVTPTGLNDVLTIRYSYSPTGISKLHEQLRDTLNQLKKTERRNAIAANIAAHDLQEINSRIANENQNLKRQLSQQTAEISTLRTIFHGSDQKLSIYEILRQDMNLFIREESMALQRAIAERDLQIAQLGGQIESLRQAEEAIANLRDKMVVSPHWPRQDLEIDDDLVFVLMPFSEEWSDDVWRLLRQIVENDCRLRCRRADMETGRVIMHDIWEGICKAKFVIADLTGGNANVAYEVGLADVVGKEVIPLSQDPRAVPFDFLGIRLITYQNSIAGARELSTKLRDRMLPSDERPRRRGRRTG